jgi:hypothetical protein
MNLVLVYIRSNNLVNKQKAKLFIYLYFKMNKMVLKIMEQNLIRCTRNILIPLWAKATEIKCSNPIIIDEKAIEIIKQIEYDFSKFDDQWPTQISKQYELNF